MWEAIANMILKYRKALLIGCGVYFLWMGYWTTQVELFFEMRSMLPDSDPAQVDFKKFEKAFGNDRLTLVIGLQDSSLYQLPKFLKYKHLVDTIKQIKGVTQMLSIVDAPRLVKDLKRRRFQVQPFFSSSPKTQAALDSVLKELWQQRFYKEYLFNSEAILMIILLEKDIFNSKERYQLMENILTQGKRFSKETNIRLYYGGLPYIRYASAIIILREIYILVALSLILTLAVFYLIFRSLKVVLPCALLVSTMGFSVFGTIAVLSYKITLLTGLIPPIIIIISMTNCVYMVNKYHQAYTEQKDKEKALQQTIVQIGWVSLITNLTTAIGFMVFFFVEAPLLREFGIVAGLNILMIFILTMALLPTLLSFLPSPTDKQTKHVSSVYMRVLLQAVYRFVYRYKRAILLVGGLLVAVAIYGASLVETNRYMRDDISSAEEVIGDIRFFEKHFTGVIPLEIVIHTDQKRGFLKQSTQIKLDSLEQALSQLPSLSSSLSFNRLLKAARQAYYNDEAAFYALPTTQDRLLIMLYLRGIGEDEANMYRVFVDSTEHKIRLSLRVADIGSKALIPLSDSIQSKIESIFAKEDKTEVHLTGTMPLFIKDSYFMIRNLFQTLIIAFVLIALIMALLFRRVSMIWTSLLINLIPLLMVLGIMGFFGLSLKPSVILIFSASFGISVDNSIHFLARYRISLKKYSHVLPALHHTITQIGSSMIYTMLILLVGFCIFTVSSFHGAQIFGILTTLTLALALLSNLLLLPALLLVIERRKPQAKYTKQPKNTANI